MSDLCRSCQAPVLWMEHLTSGKPAPIDAQTSTDGNIRVGVQGRHYRVLSGQELADAREVGELLHTNHFMTCPQSQAWRARKARP